MADNPPPPDAFGDPIEWARRRLPSLAGSFEHGYNDALAGVFEHDCPYDVPPIPPIAQHLWVEGHRAARRMIDFAERVKRERDGR